MQDHGQHDHARAGYARSTDRGQGGGEDDGEHLGHGQGHAEAGGDEEGADALINGCAAHVDGRAQGQGEGCDVFASAQLFGTFQVQGQGPHGGGTGKGHHHGRAHALEEVPDAHAAHGFYGGGVDQDRLQNIADIGRQQDDGQGAQDLRAVFRHHGGDEAENTDGAEGDDHFHDLHADLVDALHEVSERLGFLAHQNNGEAKEQRSYNDL